MPADDWALAQGTVDFRNEERRHRNSASDFIAYARLHNGKCERCCGVLPHPGAVETGEKHECAAAPEGDADGD